MAEKFGAKVVVASSYRPVTEDRVRHDQREAPEDIQWSINPTAGGGRDPAAVEERARGRGLEAGQRGP